MNREQLMSDLTTEEGFRSLVYDDATGQPLKQGSILRGNPTVAVGWNIAGLPCTPDLGQIILGYWVDKTWADVQAQIPWAVNIPEPVQRALTNMAFNLGVHGLLGFNTFLSFIQAGNYSQAAEDLATTLWFKEVGTRGPKIQALILGAIP